MANLALLDWVALFLYAAVIVTIGVVSGRKEKDTNDYFLAGRSMPWWAVMVSIYATSLSALTFIGVPGAAYAGDFHYLQLGLGDLFGRILIAILFLSAYYRGNVTTVYELLGQRFGAYTHTTGSIFFLITRLLASGVRLAGCAIALSIVFNLPINTAIFLIALIALLYTMVGGIKAVIWTDMIQFLLLVSAALIAIGTILFSLPNGWQDFTAIGNAHQKFKIFHISFTSGAKDYWLNISSPESFIAGFLFGCFTTLAVLGTDQDLVQRMLTCKNAKESKRAIIWTAVLNFPVTLLFLSVGAALYVYYNVFFDPEVSRLVSVKKMDYIFPHFIKTVLSPGLRGLLIAGLIAAAMSSLDSALNALASTFYIDIYKKYIRPDSSDTRGVKISRLFVFMFSLILALIAILFSSTESILWLGFKIFGYTYGAMLGIYLLAVLTKERGNDFLNVFIMISSVVLVIFLTAKSLGPLNELRNAILSPLGVKKIAWPWSIMIGMIWTFFIGMLFNNTNKT